MRHRGVGHRARGGQRALAGDVARDVREGVARGDRDRAVDEPRRLGELELVGRADGELVVLSCKNVVI